MKSLKMNSRNSQKGMSLAEALIAVAVFTVVFLAALALYQAANRAYMATDAATIQQQNARFAIDRITETLRDGGANYSPRGAGNLADEQIEGAWESAIIVRGDYNNSRETARESVTHPMVTTGNDEIVGYVLRQPGANTRTINILADVTPTVRDAVKTSSTATTGEETRTIEVAARTLAEQTNPPYQLARVTFNASGDPVYNTIAENIFRLSFSYLNDVGTAVITVTTSPGSANAERPVRATVRSIGVNLISMADRADFGYTDPNTYVPAEGAATKNRRKFALAEQILATNLGMKGRRHTFRPAIVLNAPAGITACTGHHNSFKISWPASTTPGVTTYQLSIVSSTLGITDSPTVTGTEYRYRQPVSTVGNFDFQVAAISAGTIGTYSPTVTVQTTHEVTKSIPVVPVNVTGSQATGINALLVNWDPVLTNLFPLTLSSCTTAGAGAGASVPTLPWGQEAVDLASHEVYRERYTGSVTSTGTFTPSAFASPNNNPPAGNQVDDQSILDLANNQATSSGSVLTGRWNFTDNTAAPCSQYFYRVKAVDSAGLKAPGAGSAPMAAPVYFAPGATDQPAKPQKPFVSGAVGTAGGNFNLTLAWLPVVRTAGGERAATAHYQLLRERKIGPTGTWTPFPLAFPDFYERTSTFEVVPSTDPITGLSISYQYAVKAIYDCASVSAGADRSDVSDWYELVCAPPAGNSIAVTSPPSGAGISRPFETGFAPRLTTVGTVWTGATVDILNPAGQSVPGYPQTINTPPVGNQYNFAVWDSTGLPNGTYTLVAVGLASSCQSPPVNSTFNLESGQCGLSIVTPTWNNQYDDLTFRVRNNCDFASLSVTGFKFSWFNGGTNHINTIQYPNGTNIRSGLSTAQGANGATIPFSGCPGACTTVVIAPGATSSVFSIEFNDNMTATNAPNGNPKAQFNSIEATISSPVAIQEEIVDAPPAP